MGGMCVRLAVCWGKQPVSVTNSRVSGMTLGCESRVVGSKLQLWSEASFSILMLLRRHVRTHVYLPHIKGNDGLILSHCSAYSMAYLHGRNALGTRAVVCVHFIVGLGCCTGCVASSVAVLLLSLPLIQWW